MTKLVYYDERSLYFEQRFVSLHDGFVRAVALCKNTVVGGSARQMVDSLGAGGMDMPKEVGWAGREFVLRTLYYRHYICTLGHAVFPGGSDLMNTSRISDLMGQEGPKTVFIGPI